LLPLLAEDGRLLMLVKPQFELQPAQIGKGGLVRDPLLHDEVARRLREHTAAIGLRLLAWIDSPITGGDGNREFFMLATPAPRAR
jgi:23S rRNA (cytidine1920-2'-O)/16S rRNA (cytidine1409-2'-O)-methyltransferase